MLGLPEYRSYSAELLRLGQKYDGLIADQLLPTTTKAQAVKIAQDVIPAYSAEYRGLLSKAMSDIAENAVMHHAKLLGLQPDVKKLTARLVANQLNEKYYGYTLTQRLTVRERQIVRQAVQTAQVDPQKIAGLFNQRVPFGAVTSIDRRLLQGTSVKIEQDAAKIMGEAGDIPFLRWTLAGGHKAPCMCEEYATQINKDVVDYLNAHDLKIDPKGLYFREELPPPPHPNCQCEFGFVTSESEKRSSFVHRAVQTVRNILRRLRGK